MSISYQRPVLNMDIHAAEQVLMKRFEALQLLIENFDETTSIAQGRSVFLDFIAWDDFNKSLFKNIFTDESIYKNYIELDIHFRYSLGDLSGYRQKASRVIFLKSSLLSSIYQQITGGLFCLAIETRKNTTSEVLGWQGIYKDYNTSKSQCMKKINFITSNYSRKIIVRDIEQAYNLKTLGYAKPAVLLAGAVLEELLRQYLVLKDLLRGEKTFENYIKICEENHLLKSGISSIGGSIRFFRNYIHLEKEVDSKHTISTATANASISAIFMTINDF